MPENVREIAYSPLLWLVTIAGIALVILLAIIYLRKSIRMGREVGITDEQVKIAIKTSSLTAIGPSIVIMVGMLSLLNVVGAPTAWLRLSVVGNVVYELMSGSIAADAFGTTISSTAITPEIFQTTLFLMAFGVIGCLMVPVLLCKQLDKLQNKINGTSMKTAILVSTAAVLGCYAYVSGPYIVSADKSTVALVAGFILMYVLQKIHKKTGKRWLLEWGTLIAMFGGMIAAVAA